MNNMKKVFAINLVTDSAISQLASSIFMASSALSSASIFGFALWLASRHLTRWILGWNGARILDEVQRVGRATSRHSL